MFHRSKAWPLFTLCILIVTGCSSNNDCAFEAAVLTDSGLKVEQSCSNLSVTLSPEVKVDDTWRSGACTLADNTLTCLISELGRLQATITDGDAELVFHAESDLEVAGLRWFGEGTIPGADTVLSNGFQSWSHSGLISLGGAIGNNQLLKALNAQGDEEVLREGRELSWWYSYAGSQAGPSLMAGVTEVNNWHSWTRIYNHPESEGLVQVELTCGGNGETIAVATGDKVSAETWYIAGGNDLHGMLRTHASHITTRRTEYPIQADVGWNSWYDLWDKVSAQDVLDNATIASDILTPHLPESVDHLRIVVDDGWQEAWGMWTPNEKFPDGLVGVAESLAADNMKAGVWLAPLLVGPGTTLAQEHPEWLVQGAEFGHPVHGGLKVLDVTHPEAAEHLKNVIQTIVGWGYDLLKIDFLFAGTFPGGRYEDMTGMQAYKLAMQIIREAAGEETILLAVGAPSIPSLPYADSWRLGPDIAFEPTDANWFFIPAQARSIAARWHLCEITLCDADPVLLRGLPQEEVETAGWVAAIAGGAWFLSDDLRDVDESRYEWGVDDYRSALAIGTKPAYPTNLYVENPPRELASIVNDIIVQETTIVLPSTWMLPDGQTLIMNMTDSAMTTEQGEIPAHASRNLGDL